jgi:hypothetical protein
VDRFGAAAGTRSLGELPGLAATSGCSLLLAAPGGVEHLLVCPALDVRGDTVLLTARIVFLAGDDATPDPAAADRVRVAFDARGDALVADGVLEFSIDLLRGLVAEGDIHGTFDGCDLDGTFENVTVRTFADAPGGGFGSVFASGNIDLGVRVPGGRIVRGTAALAGRNALVALELDGRHTQADLILR